MVPTNLKNLKTSQTPPIGKQHDILLWNFVQFHEKFIIYDILFFPFIVVLLVALGVSSNKVILELSIFDQ